MHLLGGAPESKNKPTRGGGLLKSSPVQTVEAVGLRSPLWKDMSEVGMVVGVRASSTASGTL